MKGIRTTVSTAACLVGLALILGPAPAAADFVINDDLIVDGSACVGFDCVNGESFSFDTIRLKEHNLRIHFDDTSTASSFPDNDWRIVINSSSNGGGRYFRVEDVSGNRSPFTIEANARSHSLYVDDGGRLGLRTSTPSTEIHTIDGDTPTLRLQQDGSSGFAPQSWDVAGNETNFFIRDVTNGSQLPFRIRPDAPTSSIYIDVDGDTGFGTSSVDEEIHVLRSGADDVFVKLENTNASAQNSGFSFVNSAATWNMFNNSTGNLQFNLSGTGQIMSLDSSGDLTLLVGDCSDAAGGGGCTPDYVFEPDYELLGLDELAAFVAKKKHLPNVPSAAENERNGISMRGLSFAMLEKIEELVLYTFQQQATIDGQQATIEALQERLEKLEQRAR